MKFSVDVPIQRNVPLAGGSSVRGPSFTSASTPDSAMTGKLNVIVMAPASSRAFRFPCGAAEMISNACSLGGFLACSFAHPIPAARTSHSRHSVRHVAFISSSPCLLFVQELLHDASNGNFSVRRGSLSMRLCKKVRPINFMKKCLSGNLRSRRWTMDSG